MRKIGLIVPSSNTTMEYDFMTRFPYDRASIHISRMYIESTDRKSEEKMIHDYLPQAIKDLASANVNSILFGCTSAGTLHGSSSETELKEEVKAYSDADCITVTESVSNILHKNNIKKIALFTPYIRDLHNSVKSWLEREGIAVIAGEGMGITQNLDIAKVDPKEIATFTQKTLLEHNLLVKNGERYKLKEIEAVFFSCTNFPAWAALQYLHRDIDGTFLTSNKAIFDYSMAKFFDNQPWISN